MTFGPVNYDCFAFKASAKFTKRFLTIDNIVVNNTIRYQNNENNVDYSQAYFFTDCSSLQVTEMGYNFALLKNGAVASRVFQLEKTSTGSDDEWEKVYEIVQSEANERYLLGEVIIDQNN